MCFLISAALAGSWSSDFSDGSVGDMTGAEVQEGVLVITERGRLDLAGLESFEGRMRVRLAEGDSFRVELSDSWWADYAAGEIRLGESVAALPPAHLDWSPDSSPVFPDSEDYWDGANRIHCDALEVDGTWYLYWSGEMASGYPYRQIGLATSTDGKTWTKHALNPVLTIDYDKTTVDGIHVHMPTVVEDDGAWTMLYSCYQNDVGNRLCRASSEDGLSWTPQGVAVDLGAEGTFDSGSLRMPEMWIDASGTWQLLYNGTDPEQHYGPTGWATSPDGVTWTKHGAITANEDFLQGGGVLSTAYGVEQWWNYQDRFFHAWADESDLSTWTSTGEMMPKTALPGDYGAGYIQAPTMVEDGTTHHMFFNSYGADAEGRWMERLWHAQSEPKTGQWFDLELVWAADVLEVRWADDGGVAASASVEAPGADSLKIVTEGRVEVASVDFTWTVEETPIDSDPPDSPSDSPVDSEPIDSEPEEVDEPEDTPPSTTEPGCGCASTSGAPAPLALVLLFGYFAGHRRRKP